MGTTVRIDVPQHPLAGGHTGFVPVYSIPQALAAALPEGVRGVASSPQDAEAQVVCFVQDGDALANGASAPARRVALFGGQANAYTYRGWDLFDAAVAFAAGLEAGVLMCVRVCVCVCVFACVRVRACE